MRTVFKAVAICAVLGSVARSAPPAMTTGPVNVGNMTPLLKNCTPKSRLCRNVIWTGSISFSRTCSQLQGECSFHALKVVPGLKNRSYSGNSGISSGGPR